MVVLALTGCAKDALHGDDRPPDVYLGELRDTQTHLRRGSSQKGREVNPALQNDLRGALFHPIRYLGALR